MEKPDLRIVAPVDTERRERATVAGLAAAVALAAATSWSIGVDAARRPVVATEVASEAVQRALEHGSTDADVRTGLVELRRTLGRRPLDSRTRVIYADLLLSLSRRLEDTSAAARHAARSAELAPVTVPVVQRAAMVLTRAGRSAPAVGLIRDMFAYDPEAAADLLLMVEPMLYTRERDAALPDDPEAWLAWARRLRNADRLDESLDAIDQAHERWPDNLPLLRLVAARRVAAADVAGLQALFPQDFVIPASEDAAPVLAYRARLKTFRGDLEGARSDLELALRAGTGSNLVHIVAGEGYEALGDFDEARRQWNRALFELGADDASTRVNVLARLARLEDRHGRPADALRHWESLLRLEPSHTEARRRVEALTSLGG